MPNRCGTCARVKRPKKPRLRKPARLLPGDRIGPWRIESELGSGGMASVYAVTHTGFGKRAALKLAHPSTLDAQMSIEMFVREARIVNVIDHAHVPDVFATGTYDRRPYLVMERLHGKTLREYFGSSVVEIGKTHALDILFDICSVMAAAHAHGVVHRDIKLDNIFVVDTPAEAPLQIKVLDWGVAKLLGEADPMAGMVAGTLTYVAPEQLRDGGEITTAADVYSLGVLAYQLLFGQPPFFHTNDLELICMHLKAPPPRPANLWSEIPPGLEETLLAMLAKEPGQRPKLDAVLPAIDAARKQEHAHAPLRVSQTTLLGFVKGLVTRLRKSLATNDYEIIEVIDLPNDVKQAL